MEINTEVMKVVPCINPAAALTANGTTVGATIDARGYEGLTFNVHTGVVTDGTLTGLIYGGDAANMSDEVVLTSAQLIGSAPAVATSDDGVCERVGVNLGAVRKSYYRLKMTQAGATTGAFISAQAILTHPRFAPVASP